MTLKLEEGQDIYKTKGMIRAEFDFWVGLTMDKFYDGLQNKKFVGSKCSKCSKVFLPPRNRCGDCFAVADKFVDLPETGVLENFTITNWKVTERGARQVKKETIVGMVKVDNSNTSLIVPIVNATSDKLKEGMKVKAVWAKKQKGTVEDLEGFEPAGGA